MSQLSKQALKTENQTSFPNNTTNYITPAILRDFNVSMIDSLVDENTYNVDSASWNTSINALNTFSASQQPTFNALNAFTASQLVINTGVNSFTQSANSSISQLNTYTASFTTSVGIYDEGTFVNNVNQINFTGNGITASYVSGKAVVGVDFTSLNSFTASQTIINTQLNSFTSSQNVKNTTLETVTASLNATTASQQISINALNTNSASVNISIAALNSFTASDNTSQAALNSYTASQNTRNTTLAQWTGSVAQTTASLNTFSASAKIELNNLELTSASVNISINNLNQTTESLNTSASLALITASVSGQTMTFTKGNGTTFSVILPAGSGSAIDTGSFVTTSSFNAYTSSLNTSISNLNTATASFSTIVNTLVAATGSYATTGSNTFAGVEAINYISGSGLGEVYLLANSGSLVIGNSTATPTYAALSFLSSSVVNANTNLIFKTNTNTTGLTVSGSANLFVPPNVPSAEFKRYLGGSGNLALLASVMPQITGSNQISPTFTNNIFQGNGFFMRTPNSSSVWTISANSFNNFGNINIGTAAATSFISASAGFQMNNNFVGGTFSTTAYKTQLYGPVGVIQSYFGGTLAMNNDSSSITFVNSAMQGALTINNSYNSGLLTNANGLALSAGNVFMGSFNNVYASGSNTTATTRQIIASAMIGMANSASVNLNGDNSQLNSVALIGHSLAVTGSSAIYSTAQTGSDRGTVIVGRFNKEVLSGNTVFVVGSGTSYSTRKNAILVDSGSNMYVEGTLNVSGSTVMTGSLTLFSSSVAPADLYMYGHKMFNVGGFQTNVTQSGSANVSQSVNFEVIDISYGVSIVSNSRITVANAGTYSLTFSAQLLADAGSDVFYMWLKKNGTNVAESATRLALRNNETNLMTVNFIVDAIANDYFELAWQTDAGDGVLISAVASGNIPAIPAVIVTVIQVR